MKEPFNQIIQEYRDKLYEKLPYGLRMAALKVYKDQKRKEI